MLTKIVMISGKASIKPSVKVITALIISGNELIIESITAGKISESIERIFVMISGNMLIIPSNISEIALIKLGIEDKIVEITTGIIFPIDETNCGIAPTKALAIDLIIFVIAIIILGRILVIFNMIFQ